MNTNNTEGRYLLIIYEKVFKIIYIKHLKDDNDEASKIPCLFIYRETGKCSEKLIHKDTIRKKSKRFGTLLNELIVDNIIGTIEVHNELFLFVCEKWKLLCKFFYLDKYRNIYKIERVQYIPYNINLFPINTTINNFLNIDDNSTSFFINSSKNNEDINKKFEVVNSDQAKDIYANIEGFDKNQNNLQNRRGDTNTDGKYESDSLSTSNKINDNEIKLDKIENSNIIIANEEPTNPYRFSNDIYKIDDQNICNKYFMNKTNKCDDDINNKNKREYIENLEILENTTERKIYGNNNEDNQNNFNKKEEKNKKLLNFNTAKRWLTNQFNNKNILNIISDITNYDNKNMGGTEKAPSRVQQGGNNENQPNIKQINSQKMNTSTHTLDDNAMLLDLMNDKNEYNLVNSNTGNNNMGIEPNDAHDKCFDINDYEYVYDSNKKNNSNLLIDLDDDKTHETCFSENKGDEKDHKNIIPSFNDEEKNENIIDKSYDTNNVKDAPKSSETQNKCKDAESVKTINGDIKDLINNYYFNANNYDDMDKRDPYFMGIKNDNTEHSKNEEDKLTLKMDIPKILKMIQKILCTHMYYSYDFDLTQCIQKKRRKNIEEKEREPLLHHYSSLNIRKSYLKICEKKFMWNYQMIKKIKNRCKIDDNWFCPVIQGYISYTSIEMNKKRIELFLISRRSSMLGGTRFNKRGINDDGYVANFVESEQIIRIDNRDNMSYKSRFDKVDVDSYVKKVDGSKDNQNDGIKMNKSMGGMKNEISDTKGIDANKHEGKEIEMKCFNNSLIDDSNNQEIINKSDINEREMKPARMSIYRNIINKHIYKKPIEIDRNKCINNLLNFENRIISLVQIRGSVPLFWKQHSMSSHVNIERSSLLSIKAFKEHNKKLIDNYGNNIYYINLLSQNKNNEKKLTKKLIELMNCVKKDDTYKEKDFLNYIEYDFHISVKNKSFDDAMDSFINNVLLKQIKNVSFFVEPINNENNMHRKSTDSSSQSNESYIFQDGIFRTNCLDCLDRTNVFQYYYSLFFILYILNVSKNDNFLNPVKKSSINFPKNASSIFSNNKLVTILSSMEMDNYLLEPADRSPSDKLYEYNSNVYSSGHGSSPLNNTNNSNLSNSDASKKKNNNESSGHSAVSFLLERFNYISTGGSNNENSNKRNEENKNQKDTNLNATNMNDTYNLENRIDKGYRVEQNDEYVYVLKHLFKKMWVENGDIISTHYTGTGSVFSSQINVGRSSISTNIDHAIKSIERFYQNNFEDNFRQECIDIILCAGKYSNKHKKRNYLIGGDLNYLLNYNNFINMDNFIKLCNKNPYFSIPHFYQNMNNNKDKSQINDIAENSNKSINSDDYVSIKAKKDDLLKNKLDKSKKKRRFRMRLSERLRRKYYSKAIKLIQNMNKDESDSNYEDDEKCLLKKSTPRSTEFGKRNELNRKKNGNHSNNNIGSNNNKLGKERKKHKSDLIYVKNLYKKGNFIYSLKDKNKFGDLLSNDLINQYYVNSEDSKFTQNYIKNKNKNYNYEEKIIKLWTGTWNLCGSDIYELNDISSWLNENNEYVDMYVFCFQEVVELTGFRILMNMKDTFKEKKIEQKITQTLAEISQRQKEMYLKSQEHHNESYFIDENTSRNENNTESNKDYFYDSYIKEDRKFKHNETNETNENYKNDDHLDILDISKSAFLNECFNNLNKESNEGNNNDNNSYSYNMNNNKNYEFQNDYNFVDSRNYIFNEGSGHLKGDNNFFKNDGNNAFLTQNLKGNSTRFSRSVNEIFEDNSSLGLTKDLDILNSDKNSNNFFNNNESSTNYKGSQSSSIYTNVQGEFEPHNNRFNKEMNVFKNDKQNDENMTKSSANSRFVNVNHNFDDTKKMHIHKNMDSHDNCDNIKSTCEKDSNRMGKKNDMKKDSNTSSNIKKKNDMKHEKFAKNSQNCNNNNNDKYFLNLKKFKYVKLKSVSMIGLFIIIFIDEGLVDHIRELDVCKVKVGLKGNTGNKGSVSVKFRLGFNSFCFNNIHLASGQTNIFERNSQMQSILNNSFQSQELNNLFNFDYFFACGDFNFRINQDHEEVFKLISNKNIIQLLNYDQFIYNKLYNILPFCLFYESPITFNPTYKYKKNSNIYDVRRTPAWCDRVLLSGKLIQLSELEKKRKEFIDSKMKSEQESPDNNIENSPSKNLTNKEMNNDNEVNDFYYNDRIYFKPMNYKTHNNFFSSDHKPVSAIIELKVFFDKKDIEYKSNSSYSVTGNDEFNHLTKNSSNTSNSSNNKNSNLLDYFFPNNYGISKYTSYPISQILNYSTNNNNSGNNNNNNSSNNNNNNSSNNNKLKSGVSENNFQQTPVSKTDPIDEYSIFK
ncbi:inositol-phosphate phosphatase, putative [Plasmodium chabaudi adami]|uniref:phosphoinositide 5-phosphatase n=1 Tax=Plasmodium chabaudi adami TaxID=5826 RepID=A0A1C6Y9J7_PLACE|nr:inositol-phosphate phosphatase, putative [Plasmodium chabaudi adami]